MDMAYVWTRSTINLKTESARCFISSLTTLPHYPFAYVIIRLIHTEQDSLTWKTAVWVLLKNAGKAKRRERMIAHGGGSGVVPQGDANDGDILHLQAGKQLGRQLMPRNSGK